MSEIEWSDEDVSPTSYEKYPQLLAQIKGEQLASTRHRGLWAKLANFKSEQSGRDLAYRLKEPYPEFEFVSRKEGDKVTVYARLKGEVAK